MVQTTMKREMATAVEVRQADGPWWRVLKAFQRDPLAMLSLCYVLLLLVLAIGAPITGRYDPTLTVLANFEKPPSWAHWLGNDSAGRDIWSRLIWGARNSLVVGVLAVTISSALGIVLGAISGYYGGVVDSVLMRITDAFLAFPGIVLMLLLASVLGPSIFNVILVLGLLSWTGIARLVRGQFLSLRETDFALAARALGGTNWRIIRKHLLPHVISPVVVSMTFGVGGAILSEAGLSYLGLGVRQPNPSWGTMLSEAQSVHVLQSLPWVWLSPGITLLLMVLSVNFVGDTFRQALDPYGQGK